MTEAKTVLDPRRFADISKDKYDWYFLKGIVEDHPGLRLVPFIMRYFPHDVSPAQAAGLLTTPDDLEVDTKIYRGLAYGFHDYVRAFLPKLHDPFCYDREEAKKICDLYSELQQFHRCWDESVQNPFNRVFSLKHLCRLSGVSSGNIAKIEHNDFFYGSLKLTFNIERPEKKPIKSAIHSSVHSHDGRARLDEACIAGNVLRIQNKRRMVRIVPHIRG